MLSLLQNLQCYASANNPMLTYVANILQIVQHIATFLPGDDKHLANLTTVCQQTYIALRHWQSRIWRYRFANSYDLGPGYLGEK